MRPLGASIVLLSLACMGGSDTPPPPADPEPAPVVAPAPPAPLPPLSAYGSAPGRFYPFADGAKVYLGVDGAKIRAEPDAEAVVVHEGALAAEVLVVESVGEPVELIGRLHRWVKVRSADKDVQFEGYVFGSLLTPIGGKTWTEQSGAEHAWALSYSPKHGPRLRVQLGEDDVQSVDLRLTEMFEGGTLEGRAPGWGDFDMGFEVEQCALASQGKHPDCVIGKARLIEGKLTQFTVVDRWKYDRAPVKPAVATCGRKTLVVDAQEPVDALEVELPSYMRGPSSQIQCKTVGMLSSGAYRGRSVVECPVFSGGKSTPEAIDMQRFLVGEKDWTRVMCSSGSHGDEELLDRLGDLGIQVHDTWSVTLGGPYTPHETLEVDNGSLRLFRHASGSVEGGERLFTHDVIGPVYTDDQGDLFVPQSTGRLRYRWDPGVFDNTDMGMPAGEWEAASYGCGGDIDKGNTVLPADFTASGDGVGRYGDESVRKLVPADAPYAALMKEVRGSFKYASEPPTNTEFENLPFLTVQDPWGRWNVLTRKSLRPPDMCEPIVYLYSDPPQPVDLRFGDGLTVVRTWPPTETGWSAWAQPDGRVRVEGRLYDHLFWDGHSVHFPRARQGWVVPRRDLRKALEQLLPTLGLIGREIDEAIAAWTVPGDSPWIRIGVHPPERIEHIAPLSISPLPDTTIRVYVELEGVEEPQDIAPPPAWDDARKGLVFVEWGMIERQGR